MALTADQAARIGDILDDTPAPAPTKGRRGPGVPPPPPTLSERLDDILNTPTEPPPPETPWYLKGSPLTTGKIAGESLQPALEAGKRLVTEGLPAAGEAFVRSQTAPTLGQELAFKEREQPSTSDVIRERKIPRDVRTVLGYTPIPGAMDLIERAGRMVTGSPGAAAAELGPEQAKPLTEAAVANLLPLVPQYLRNLRPPPTKPPLPTSPYEPPQLGPSQMKPRPPGPPGQFVSRPTIPPEPPGISEGAPAESRMLPHLATPPPGPMTWKGLEDIARTFPTPEGFKDYLSRTPNARRKLAEGKLTAEQFHQNATKPPAEAPGARRPPPEPEPPTTPAEAPPEPPAKPSGPAEVMREPGEDVIEEVAPEIPAGPPQVRYSVQWGNPYTEPPGGQPRVLFSARGPRGPEIPPEVEQAYKDAGGAGSGWSVGVDSSEFEKTRAPMSPEARAKMTARNIERRAETKMPLFKDEVVAAERERKGLPPIPPEEAAPPVAAPVPPPPRPKPGTAGAVRPAPPAKGPEWAEPWQDKMVTITDGADRGVFGRVERVLPHPTRGKDIPVLEIRSQEGGIFKIPSNMVTQGKAATPPRVTPQVPEPPPRFERTQAGDQGVIAGAPKPEMPTGSLRPKTPQADLRDSALLDPERAARARDLEASQGSLVPPPGETIPPPPTAPPPPKPAFFVQNAEGFEHGVPNLNDPDHVFQIVRSRGGLRLTDDLRGEFRDIPAWAKGKKGITPDHLAEALIEDYPMLGERAAVKENIAETLRNFSTLKAAKKARALDAKRAEQAAAERTAPSAATPEEAFRLYAASKGYKRQFPGKDAYGRTPGREDIRMLGVKNGKIQVFEAGSGRYEIDYQPPMKSPGAPPSGSPPAGGAPEPNVPPPPDDALNDALRFWDEIGRDETGAINLRNFAKTWKKFRDMFPQESAVRGARPNSPMLAQIERATASLADWTEARVSRPWAKELKKLDPERLKDAEVIAVNEWKANGRTPQAELHARRHFPPSVQIAMRQRDILFDRANQARANWGLDPIKKNQGPYLPRVVEGGREAVNLMSEDLGGGQSLRSTTPGGHGQERVFETYREGEAQGMEYVDPRNAILLRDWNDMKILATDQLFRNLIAKGGLFRGNSKQAAEAAMRAARQASRARVQQGGQPYTPAQIEAIGEQARAQAVAAVKARASAAGNGSTPWEIEGAPGGTELWAPTEQEAKLLKQNLAQQGRGSFGSLTHYGNALFRNPNLVNPLPHVVKNMGVKELLAQGPVGMARLIRDAAELQRGSNPQMISDFNEAMAFAKSGRAAAESLNRGLVRWGGNLNPVTWIEALSSVNEPSRRVIFGGKLFGKHFEGMDQFMRYSLYKHYRNGGRDEYGRVRPPMGLYEAGNHAWEDLIRYGTRSDATDFWRRMPLNFYVPWRFGTFAALMKQIKNHPVRTMLLVGAIDYLREMDYRANGATWHLPWDYTEKPLAAGIEAAGEGPAAAAKEIGKTGIQVFALGPGGDSAARQIGEAWDAVQGKPHSFEFDKLASAMWGVTQLYNVPVEMYKGNLGAAVGSLLVGRHPTYNYEPKRLAKYLPEWLPGMTKSEAVREAEDRQEGRRERARTREENRKPPTTIEQQLREGGYIK